MNAKFDVTGIVLKTERLTLRPFKEEDLEDFFEYAKVEGVGEMAGWPHHEAVENTKFVLNMFIDEKKTFALEYNGKVIGSLGVEFYPEKEFPEFSDKQGREIGYVLAKDYWGLGLVPEAVKEVIRYLFDELHYDFLVCGHFKRNNQSYRVQEKCGFKHYKETTYHTLMGTAEDAWFSILLNEK